MSEKFLGWVVAVVAVVAAASYIAQAAHGELVEMKRAAAIKAAAKNGR